MELEKTKYILVFPIQGKNIRSTLFVLNNSH